MGKAKPKFGDVVEVTWYDAMSSQGEFSLADLEKSREYVCRRKTVGYYLKDYENYHVLCYDITIDCPASQTGKDFQTLQSIPQAMTTSLQVLQVAKSPQSK